MVNSGAAMQDCEELYYDICSLAVLSGCEIDRAKREFVINSMTEINILKRKYKIEDGDKSVKPRFFKMICVENGYKVPENVKYRDFDTAMDYLQKIISRFNFRESRKQKDDFLPFMSIVKEPPANVRQGYYYSRKDELIRTIREAREDIKRLYLGYEDKPLDEKEDVRVAASERRQDCIEAIMSMSDNPAVMYLTLKELDNPDSKDVSRLVFDVLFGKPNESFYNMLKESRDDIYTLEDDPDGDIEFYGLKFSKKKVICTENDLSFVAG